jgi:hypothetical protein
VVFQPRFAAGLAFSVSSIRCKKHANSMNWMTLRFDDKIGAYLLCHIMAVLNCGDRYIELGNLFHNCKSLTESAYSQYYRYAKINW